MQIAELLLLAAIWGASFLFMRIATPEFGPIALITIRVGIAALVLLPMLRTAGARQHLRSKAMPFLIAGIFSSALPFCLFAYSTLHLNAGFDSILNATTPLWTGVIAFVWLKKTMKRMQVLGLLISLVGVVVLVWGQVEGDIASSLLPILAVLLATLSYGFSSNYTKQHLADVPSAVVAAGSQLYATLVLLPLVLFAWPSTPVSSTAWYAALALGVFCTGVAYFIFFKLIAQKGASYAVSVTFLIPIFGVLWGAIFLGEKITLTMIGASLIILFGTALFTEKLKFSRALQVS